MPRRIENYTVYGRVLDKRGRPAANLLVCAYDRDLRSEVLLGEGVTDKNGKYKIVCLTGQGQEADRKKTDLAVKVFTRVKKTLLFESDLEEMRFGALPREEINITLEKEVRPEVDEYAYILREVQAAVKRVPIVSLQEDTEHRDITYLAKELDLAPERIAHLVVAHRLQAESGIGAEFFYALLRKDTLLKSRAELWPDWLFIDVNTELKPLLYAAALVDQKAVESDVAAAIQEMLVSPRVKEGLSQNFVSLQKFKNESAAYYQKERPQKILRLLGNFVLEDKVTDAENLFRDRQDNLKFFLKTSNEQLLKENPAVGTESEISVLLGELLGFEQAIVSDVKESLNLKRPADLKKLAALNKAGWREVLTKSAGRIKLAGRPLSQKVINQQASALVRKMEKRYPAVAFTAQLAREEKRIYQNQESIRDFLNQHEDFDLQTSNIPLFLKDKQLVSKISSSMQEELKSVQRVFKLVPHYRKTNALLEQNIRSAHSIVAAGRSRFLQDIAPKAGIRPAEAKAIYKKAEQTAVAAMLLAGKMQDRLGTMHVPAVHKKGLPKKLGAVSQDFPNLKSLFKLADRSECGQGRSVLSPAAYLVEILEFLDNRLVTDLTATPPVNNCQAKEVLFERRPDLGEIDLGPENAETPAPYIDLVCELLEEAVAPDEGFVYSGILADGPDPDNGRVSSQLLDACVAAGIPVTKKALLYDTELPVPPPAVLPPAVKYLRDTKAVCKLTEVEPGKWRVKRLKQTHSTAEELAAAPEYVNDQAYQILANTEFAFQLPFDLNHAEASTYLSRFNISRAELMAGFQVAGFPSDLNIAAEKLGLTDQECKLIVTPHSQMSDQQRYWNPPPHWDTDPVVSGNIFEYLQRVDHFLDKTGLTYPKLQRLLSLTFINPEGHLFLVHNYADPSAPNPVFSGDTATKEIHGLDAAALDRIHRFLRLQRKTGWPLEVLDEIICQHSLDRNHLDDCLIKAAALAELTVETGLKLDELTGFYGDFPHQVFHLADTPPSLYQQVFLNKARTGFIDERLLPESVESGSGLLENCLSSVAACLQVSEKDLRCLLKELPNGALTFASLSYLWAVTRLMRKLKLKAEELLILSRLTGIKFQESPQKTLEFVRAAAVFQKLSVPAADLLYLLGHEADNLADRELKDEKIEQVLQKLQTDLQTAFTAGKSPFDPGLPADEQKESLQKLLAELPRSNESDPHASGLSEEDLQTIIGLIDRNWISAEAAKSMVADKLGAFLEGALLLEIEARIDQLSAAAETNLEERRNALLQAMLEALTDYQFRLKKQTVLEQQIAAVFQADPEQVNTILRYGRLKQAAPGTELIGDVLTSDELLDKDRNHPVPVLPLISAAAFSKQFQALRLLHKLIPLVNAFKLDNPELVWCLTNNGSLNWLELDALPSQTGQSSLVYQKWTDLAQFLALARSLTPVVNPADAENPVNFYQVVELLRPGSTAEPAEFVEKFALLTGYAKEDVQAVVQYRHPVFSLDLYRNWQTWQDTIACLEQLRKLGCSLETVKTWLQPVLGSAETHLLRTALKSRYDEDTWLTTLKEIMDAIRPQKRKALVAYLLSVNPQLQNENGLYDYFLVDVEMEAGMPSSRIVQAHGTVQLFVQRCLMGLEPRAAANLDDDQSWEQWKWLKNYRVWEANRKVFLYPENWIEAELRDDKSFLFAEMENELLQNELTEYNTEQALIRYLEKLDQIAFLAIAAAWYQTDNKTMHVFGRTKGGDPALYYYRRFEQERYWTPWEKVELDITGQHLLAFMRNNRLCLAWPVFSEEPDPNPESTLPDQTSTDPHPADKPKRKLKVQLALSEYANQTWQPPRISIDAILTPADYFTAGDIPRENFKFYYNGFAQQIVVYNTLKSENYGEEVLAGAFNLTGCKGYPEQAEAKPFSLDFIPQFLDTKLMNQLYRETGNVDNNLAVLGAHSLMISKQPDELLGQTPGTFRLTYPHQLTIIDVLVFCWQLLINYSNSAKGTVITHSVLRGVKLPLGTLLPYFMEDSNHAYVIVPGFFEKATKPMTPWPDRKTGWLESFNLAESPEQEFQQVKRTASDALQLLQDIYAFIQALKTYQKNTQKTEEQWAELMEDCQEIVREFQVYAKLGYGEEFRNLYHPLVCSLKSTLYKEGIPAVMKRETQLQLNPSFNFMNYYQPSALVPKTYAIKTQDSEVFFYPVEDLDFSTDGSYSGYNWELFFHLPFLLAARLTQEQRFEEALTWFHYIFNPTGALSGPYPQKYWVTKPFYLTTAEDYEDQLIDNLLYKVADPNTPEIKELEAAIAQWRVKPFKPHVVARFRPVAYQKALLMKYIDNLTEWGDYLFRQDTLESIAQATQMYILADKLLGPKPRTVPPAVEPPYETYNQLKGKIDSFGNALLELENILPDLSLLPEGGAELPPAPITLSMLYFCIPQNEKMSEYWDRIADRLFKIRHCQNIDGVERSLALFAPPIDPGMLVRAAAAGLDISEVIAGVNAPAPYYRFSVLIQKATELAQEVRSLGNSLLLALEKRDVEALSLLRNVLELKLLNLVKDTKKLQIQESETQIAVLKKTKAVIAERDQYYSSLEKIITKEQLNLDKLKEAQDYQSSSQIVRTVAGALALIPEMHLGANGFGGSPEVVFQIGGSALSRAASIGADILNILSSAAAYEANRASILAGFDRRYADWKLQERLAKKELDHVEKQIAAAEIRKAIAEADLKNHELQIENAQKTDEFMRSKFTNRELYNWMVGQISSVYFRAYKLSHEFAKKAERSYRFELGNDDTFIQYGYWDSLKKGLQSADHLLYDLKRMETSYLDKNKREYELTKHVSLALLDPLALAKFRATGVCDFELPEALFDLDYAGQYFRRLKSVSISLPCIVGPYTSVSVKLSQVSNKYRKNPNPDNLAGTGYAEDLGSDERFVYNVGAIQSIAASSAQNDSGVFELNFRDERYLPFEGTGAVSSWRLELPREVRQFDYNAISDVILHLKYTAREGVSTLRGLAETTLKDRLAEIKQRLNQEGLHISINMKHDCPNEWHQFKKNGSVDFRIDQYRLPYLAQTAAVAIENVVFLAKGKTEPADFTVNIGSQALNLAWMADWKLCKGSSGDISLNTPFALSMASLEQLAELEELVLIVKYRF